MKRIVIITILIMFSLWSYANWRGAFDDAYFAQPESAASPDNYTKLLLHCDGTNTSKTFTDSSLSNNAITVIGNVWVSTEQYKFGTGSMRGSGGLDWLRCTDNISTFEFPGDFTIDMWVMFAGLSGNQGIADSEDDLYSGTVDRFFFYKTSAGGLSFGRHSVGNVATYAWNPVTNIWYHLAVARAGSALQVFIGGVSIASVSNTTSYGADGIQIGGVASVNGINGWVDEARISQGIARWTNNFTPPVHSY